MLAQLLIGTIKTLRPLMGNFGCCIYAYSCYDYGIYMLHQERLLKALSLITKRVLLCNPITSMVYTIKSYYFDTLEHTELNEH